MQAYKLPINLMVVISHRHVGSNTLFRSRYLCFSRPKYIAIKFSVVARKKQLKITERLSAIKAITNEAIENITANRKCDLYMIFGSSLMARSNLS